jgi:hypothetical protein
VEKRFQVFVSSSYQGQQEERQEVMRALLEVSEDVFRRLQQKQGEEGACRVDLARLFETIKIQFRALGLFEKSVKQRSLKDTDTFWKLTPYGDTVMRQLRAIKKA